MVNKIDMKAEIIKVLDITEPEKILFGIKITGLRRFITAFDKNGLIAIASKDEVLELVRKLNEKIESDSDIEWVLRQNKEIKGLNIASLKI